MRRGQGLSEAVVEPLRAHEVQAALPAGTLLLTYFTTGLRGPEAALLDAIPPEARGLRACLETTPKLLLLALTRESLSVHECPLNPNVFLASTPYQADGRRFLAPQILRRANDVLINPVVHMLAASQQVVIVPHGPLHQLPFAALLDRNGCSLLDRAPNLWYAPSATVLLRALAGRQSSPPKSCLALGYDGAAGRRLRHTQIEAQGVAQLCAGEAWQGEPGMCERLAQVAGSYRWLHLACHGEFNLDDPLQSWLEIGPDERLSGAEVIANFKLQADLVTLSACRSGVSRVLRGDEPMGLVRGFLSAGARAVLVTLWPVEDASARLLMEHFYRTLLNPQGTSDPPTALRAAQQYLRELTIVEVRRQLEQWGEDTADSSMDEMARPFADPAFWAAYVLIGAASSTSI